MQPTYSYPPQEPYRGSPPGGNMSLPPLNLPPIRLQDGQQPPPQQHPQHQQHQQPPQQPMGSPLPPPQHAMQQHYPPPGYAHPGQQMQMGPAQYNAMRYQLPPQGDQRVLSGGRHKKEIKRRTKTGCLTCRKRRIKCDEAHPTCRNCQKSKRECLGYDPIFKQQPGPAQIQPAPNSAPAPHSSTPPVPAQAPPAPSYQSQVPQGYAPASSAPAGYAPAAAAPSAAHDPQAFNAIDPALAAAAAPGMHPSQPQYNGMPMDPNMRHPSYAQPPPPPEPLKGKRLNVVDIFGICNHSPPDVPPRTAPPPPEIDEQFSQIFINDYVQGLDYMLQTTWFSKDHNAINRVFTHQALHEEAAFFTETIKNQNSAADMSSVFSQEARLIWHLLGSCKLPAPATNGVKSEDGGHPAETEDLAQREARARFDVLEALLTNSNVETNPLREVTYPEDVHEEKKHEIDFWLNLGDFVRYAGDDRAPHGAADIALGTMRNVLRVQEVRDAIYSIAVARHYGARIGGFPNALPQLMDPHEDSDLSKLHVAMSFISHESRAGSQQVLARICDMAMLSWAVARSP
ncbi:hypothetical protein N0V87_001525 [Didymella glomerata]|uniref:Zn(2)-C6 fungal-type domain-containing protein n=1 Tax=Didymella glomerata TaxID=749621 RepID=A0A9W9C3L9_9PLEO|nr:hypothetical protein N0V87_001525 [Didymella glomerata]